MIYIIFLLDLIIHFNQIHSLNNKKIIIILKISCQQKKHLNKIFI